jgi:hypothetical protein
VRDPPARATSPSPSSVRKPRRRPFHLRFTPPLKTSLIPALISPNRSYKIPSRSSSIFFSFPLHETPPGWRDFSPKSADPDGLHRQFRRLQGTPTPDFCTYLLPVSWRISLTTVPLLFRSKSTTSRWLGGYRRLEPSVQTLQTLGDAIELVEDIISFPASRRPSSTYSPASGTTRISPLLITWEQRRRHAISDDIAGTLRYRSNPVR